MLIADPAVTPPLQARMLDALLGQTGVTLSGLAAAAFIGVFVWFDLHWGWVFAWIAVAALATLWRFRLRQAYLRIIVRSEPIAPDTIRRFARSFVLTAWIIGALWGGLGFVILRTGTDDAIRIILMVTSAGVVAGAATRNHASPAAAYGQLLLIELPIAAGAVLGSSGWTYDMVGVLVLLNIVATASTIRHLQAQTLSVLCADAANAKLLAALHRANETLEINNLALEGLTVTDDLTGLLNRRGLMVALDRAWRSGLRDGQPVGAIMIDIDQFKLFNDQHGHVEGDTCLRAVAAALACSLLRADDSIGRYGGEEFVAILPGVAQPDATLIAERMRGAVAGLAIPHSASDHAVVTISLGVAAMRPAETDRTALLAAADAALYQAKQEGRNCCRSARADQTDQTDQAAFAMLRST
jgi:diguanylate cyclase (GGDEF)-like protein